MLTGMWPFITFKSTGIHVSGIKTFKLSSLRLVQVGIYRYFAETYLITDYMRLEGDPPAKVSQYNYVIGQVRQNFPGEYDRGIHAIDVEVNLWKAMIKQPLFGPTIPFPTAAEIDGNRLAFTIMSKYGESEATVLFRRDGAHPKTAPGDDLVQNHASALRTVYNRNEKNVKNTRQRSRFDNKGGSTRYNRNDNKFNRDSSKGRFTFRDGVFCDVCGSEGHDPSKDGCFAAGKFLRILEYFDPQMHHRIQKKYPDLVNGISSNLQKSILEKAARRKQRTARVATMELVCNAFDSEEPDECVHDIYVNAAYTIFPDVDLGNSSESEFEDASS